MVGVVPFGIWLSCFLGIGTIYRVAGAVRGNGCNANGHPQWSSQEHPYPIRNQAFRLKSYWTDSHFGFFFLWRLKLLSFLVQNNFLDNNNIFFIFYCLEKKWAQAPQPNVPKLQRKWTNNLPIGNMHLIKKMCKRVIFFI